MKKEKCMYCLKYFRQEEIDKVVLEETGEKVCEKCLKKLEGGNSQKEEELTEEEIRHLNNNLIEEYCRRNRLKREDIIIKALEDMTDEDFLNSDFEINGNFIVRKKRKGERKREVNK